MSDMFQATTSGSLPVHKNGAKTGVMSLVPHPPPDEESDEPVTVSLRFSRDEWEDYKLIAELWNKLDRVRGVKRRLKWKPSSVLRYAARQLLDSVRAQLTDWPRTVAAQEAFLHRVIAEAEKEQRELKKDQKKK